MLQFRIDTRRQVGGIGVTLFDRDAGYDQLAAHGLNDWAESLRSICVERFSASFHGTMPNWIEAWQALPDLFVVSDASIDATGDRVAVRSSREIAPDALRRTLMKFHPWRKGPFELFGLPIDTEWRSNWKWNRLRDAIEFHGKNVLDIGCGNGYYGWRMLDAGADLVVGLDPFMLYMMQFEVVRKYAVEPERHFVFPIGDAELPAHLHAFDVTLSMGVLYHRTSPIDHLQTIWNSLKPNGQVILETLVIESGDESVLVPENRYAKMRNIWFIPSVPMLRRWLSRTGFREIEIVDVSRTTVEEQRRTDWMTFESLADFLDPSDPTKTIEGYPSPVRALVTARRS